MDLSTAPTLTQFLLFLLILIVGWVGRESLKKFDEHVRTCGSNATYNSQMVQWMGDSIHQLAAKMNIELPPKPMRDKENAR